MPKRDITGFIAHFKASDGISNPGIKLHGSGVSRGLERPPGKFQAREQVLSFQTDSESHGMKEAISRPPCKDAGEQAPLEVSRARPVPLS